MNMHNVLCSLYRYFCGHDHDIQHIREQNDTVNYFVSGAGHLTDSSVSHEVSKCSLALISSQLGLPRSPVHNCNAQLVYYQLYGASFGLESVSISE